MGKEPKKQWIYVYVQLNHFAVHLELTQHCKSTILQLKKKKKEFHSPWAPMAEDADKNHAADTHVPGVHSDAPLPTNSWEVSWMHPR